MNSLYFLPCENYIASIYKFQIMEIKKKEKYFYRFYTWLGRPSLLTGFGIVFMEFLSIYGII